MTKPATPTIDELVEEFASRVIAQSDAIEEGEPGNEYADQYLEAFDQLRTRYGDEGREALSTLFDHEDANVRGRAAAFLLRYCTDRAKAVLEREAKNTGMAAFCADECLRRWAEANG